MTNVVACFHVEMSKYKFEVCVQGLREKKVVWNLIEESNKLNHVSVIMDRDVPRTRMPEVSSF